MGKVRFESTVLTTSLEEGPVVVSECYPGAHSVSVGVWVTVGSRDEPESCAGVSHFLEHLLFRGTEQRSGRSIAELIDSAGGEMNALTGKESTVFYVRLPAGGQDIATDLLGDVVCNPALRIGDIETERRVILEELYLQEDEPDSVAASLLDQALFPSHELGREILGTRETIRVMDRKTISAFHERWYRAPNIVIAAAGAVDHEQLVTGVAKSFTNREFGNLPERRPPNDSLGSDQLIRRATEAAHVGWGWRCIGRKDSRRRALALGVQILGGGLSSRLFQAVREERGLAYNVFASYQLYGDAGVVTIHAATDLKYLDELRRTVDTEVRNIVREGVTHEELEIARKGFAGAHFLGLEDSGSRMARLGNSQSLYGYVESLDEVMESLDAVKLGEVNDLLREVLGSTSVFALVGNSG